MHFRVALRAKQIFCLSSCNMANPSEAGVKSGANVAWFRVNFFPRAEKRALARVPLRGGKRASRGAPR